MKPVVALLLLTLLAGADSIAPFASRRAASPDGRHRLVLAPATRQACTFELSRGEEVLARGELAAPPADVHVLDARPAAVLFDEHGRLGHGAVLRLLDGEGKIAWSVALEELFDAKTIAAFPTTMSQIYWSRAWWVDEALGAVIVVGADGGVRSVALETGRPRVVPAGTMLGGLQLPHARSAALAAALEFEPAGLAAAAAKLPVPDDPFERLLVAAAAGTVGAEEFDAAFETKPRETIALMPRHFGDGAGERLERLARGEEHGHAAVLALSRMGKPGAKSLVAVMAHGDTPSGIRSYARTLVGGLDKTVVVAAVRREFGDADTATATELLGAAIAAGDASLHQQLQPFETKLVAILKADRGHTDWLAEHFRRHPTTEAVDALLGALAKHHRRAARRDRIVAALRACTGLDFGNDPRAWRNGLGRR